MVNMNYQVIILGSGPAGLTAAIYASRSKLKTLLIAGNEPGGQLMLTTEVEDFPGFPKGIQGPALMDDMRIQAEKFGTEFVNGNATKVDFFKRPFKISVGEKEFLGETVIIATGASSVWLGLESEQRLIGKGVSSCAVCDGPFFKERRVIVIGGGDTAMRESLHLSKFASSVTVIHRRDELRAFKALQERAFSNPKIKFVWNSIVEEFLGKDFLSGVKIKNLKDGKVSEIECPGAFVAIGHKPNTDFLKGQVDMDEKGYIKIHEDPNSTNPVKTNIEGVFAAGDVHDRRYKQAVTAAGAGCKAAMDAEEFIEKKAHES